jgi:hypothetical protein
MEISTAIEKNEENMLKAQIRGDKQIKVIRQFHIKKSADKLIQRWAKTNAFLEGNPAGQHLMNENNHAYCFYKRIESGTLCVLIDTLDQEMRVEAWVMDEIRSENHTAKVIYQLFDLLGQNQQEVDK